MSTDDSATQPSREALGIGLGFLAVLAFSITLPMTKAAVPSFGGWTIGFGRSVVAGLLAIVLLVLTQTTMPHRRLFRPLLTIAGGVVFGFPVFTALALEYVPATRGAIVVGLLPATTALVASIRHGERPTATFWFAASGGLVTVLVFAVLTGGGTRPEPGDALLLLGVACAAIGYAEGAEVSKTLGGWRTICFALVLSLPLAIPALIVAVSVRPIVDVTPKSIGAFAYLCVVSMFLGFFAWYAALSIGGTAKVSQIQLVQPILSLFWAWLLVGETVTNGAVLAAGGVVFFVGLSRRTSVVARASDQQTRRYSNSA